jgi:acetyltransferase
MRSLGDAARLDDINGRPYPAHAGIEGAMRPYPTQYVGQWAMKDGTRVLIRPIRPEDEPLMLKFHESLSERSVYLRYFHMEKLSTRVAHERLIRKCFIDYDREMALVADYLEPTSGQHQILAVGRLSWSPEKDEAEIAVLVADRHQRMGLGTELVRRLIQIGQDERIRRIVAYVLPENADMRSLADRFGFRVERGEDPSMLTAVLDLPIPPSVPTS